MTTGFKNPICPNKRKGRPKRRRYQQLIAFLSYLISQCQKIQMVRRMRAISSKLSRVYFLFFSWVRGVFVLFFPTPTCFLPAFLALFCPRMAIHLFFEKVLSLSRVHTFFRASVLHLQLYGIFQLLAKGGARSGGVSFISLLSLLYCSLIINRLAFHTETFSSQRWECCLLPTIRTMVHRQPSCSASIR